jgi:hypothetical protein
MPPTMINCDPLRPSYRVGHRLFLRTDFQNLLWRHLKPDCVPEGLALQCGFEFPTRCLKRCLAHFLDRGES